jgi:pimeloyl-ACP methyl ester carboxylesterase
MLLPGLDGTGRLFDRFMRGAPAHASVTRVAFPTDRVLSYDELVDFVSDSIPPPPLVLLGESFSGPVALRLAARAQPAAVILCASFIRAPAASRFAAAPLSLLARIVPPVSVVNTFLSGGDDALASDLVRAVRSVDAEVISSRVRLVLGVDATLDLETFPGRLLYLRPTRDRVVPKRQATLLRGIRSDAEVVEIDGPHLLLQARPTECWNHIAAFVASVLDAA